MLAFQDIYNRLYSRKNYKEEVDKTLSILRGQGRNPLHKLIEVGCGTGSHTKYFSEVVPEMWAVDIDPHMLKIAKGIPLLPNRKVHWHEGPIHTLKSVQTDAVVALFNVISYFETPLALRKFFKDVSEKLFSKGIFLFDCWNGIAAVLDPPREEIRTMNDPNESLQCKLIPQTDYFNQSVLMKYQYQLKNSQGKLETGEYSFHQSLWMPGQIKAYLEEADLQVIKICPPFKPEERGTERDWKIMFICKKS